MPFTSYKGDSCRAELELLDYLAEFDFEAEDFEAEELPIMENDIAEQVESRRIYLETFLSILIGCLIGRGIGTMFWYLFIHILNLQYPWGLIVTLSVSTLFVFLLFSYDVIFEIVYQISYTVARLLYPN